MKALTAWTFVFATILTLSGVAGCGSDTQKGVSCTLDSECDDGDGCTTDSCVAEKCFSVVVLGLSCDDGNPCTENATCDETGACTGGSDIDLTAIPCQNCTCSVEEGMNCSFDEVGASCDDKDCCTSDDSCQACDPLLENCEEGQTSCTGGTLTDCDDGNECTLSQCDCVEGDAVCSHTDKADDSPCSFSENDCTEGDTCTSGVCNPGLPLDLDDQNPCTKDLCVKGEVEHQPLAEGSCEDGNECTINDNCFLGNCVGGDVVECELPTCASGVVCVQDEGCVATWLPEGALCDDGNNCSTDEACTADHECRADQANECNDNNDCTIDTCDSVTGECTSIPADNNSPCDDGTPCTSSDVCNEGVCGGAELNCDDGISCTSDSCDPLTGCTHVGNDALCDDGDLCTVDSCDALSGCQHVQEDPSCTSTCENGTLPNNTCCPPDGFCPEEDTTISGINSFSVLYIPAGVTVTCVGDAPLYIDVSGNAWLEGTLSANGQDAEGPYDATPGSCGGYAGGDGSRMSALGITTEVAPNFFGDCDGLPENKDECWSHIAPQDNYTGEYPCAFLARAKGQAGAGPGGGQGGDMSMLIFETSEGGTGGGGGASFITQGTAGGMSASECGLKYGGDAGATYTGTVQGGSGGGGGGHARNSACDACSGGSVGAGGDGGAGGGIIILSVSGLLDFTGTISARGGHGGNGNGAASACTGGGGGGSGGVIEVQAQGLSIIEPASSHFDVSGGNGGQPNCVNPGSLPPGSVGGNGGEGHWALTQ